MTETVESIARIVGGRVEGDPDTPITGVADARSAGAGTICFLRDSSYLSLAKDSNASALIVTEQLDTDVAQIVVEDAHAAFAKVALHFHPVPVATVQTVHPSAVVHPDAVIEEPVAVGPHVTVEAGARIGAGTLLQAGCVVGAGAVVGRNCTIFPRVVIYDNVVLGDRVIVHAGAVLGSDGFGYVIENSGKRIKFPQLGSLVIGDDVEIGANTTIDRGALTPSTIGSGTKLDNLCHIGHNCKIGSDSTISAMAAFASGTVIGDRVIIAGHVLSAGSLSVCDDVTIGGNSSLLNSVKKPGEYAGYPLCSRSQYRRIMVTMRHLPSLSETVKRLAKRAKLDDSPGDDSSGDGSPGDGAGGDS